RRIHLRPISAKTTPLFPSSRPQLTDGSGRFTEWRWTPPSAFPNLSRMESILQDLRYAVRQLARTPIFSLAAAATLAIGIGATTAIFSTVNATLLRPLPFPHSAELMAIR